MKSDPLKVAIHRVRNGLSTDYEPRDVEEKMILAYCRSSFALHDGDIEEFDRINGSQRWHQVICDLQVYKRARYVVSRKEFLNLVCNVDTQAFYDASKDLSTFWQLETLAMASAIEVRRHQFEAAETFYRRLKDLAASQDEHNRHGEALSNLGILAAYAGRVSVLRSYIAEARNYGRRSGSLIHESIVAELSADLAWTTGDRAVTYELLSGLSVKDPDHSTDEDQVHILSTAYDTLVSVGDMEEAEKVARRLRRCVAGKPVHIWPTAIKEVEIAKALRTFDPDLQAHLARSIQTEGLTTFWIKGKIDAAVLIARYACRVDEQFLETAQACLKSAENEAHWARSLGVKFDLAKAYVALRISGNPDRNVDELLANARRFADAGRMIDARETWFFAIETLVACDELNRALAELRRWVRACVEGGFNFDAELGRALMLAMNSRAEIETDASDALAKRASQNLLRQWPWRQIASPNALTEDETAISASSKANELIALLSRSPGKIFELERIVSELWEEAYNPFVHPNRLYQTAREARMLLAQASAPHWSLVSRYGKGYILRAQSDSKSPNFQSSSIQEDVKSIFLSQDVEIGAEDVALRLNVTVRHARRLLSALETKGEVVSRKVGKSKIFRLNYAKPKTG